MKAKRIFPALAALLSVALLLFAAPVAGAASSSEAGYDESAPLAQVGGGDEGGSTSVNTAGAAPEAAASGNSTLPFTGMELSLVALLGIALIGMGLLLKRVSRPPTV